MKLESYTFQIDSVALAKIEELAKEGSRSVASQMRIAIDKYLESLNA